MELAHAPNTPAVWRARRSVRGWTTDTAFDKQYYILQMSFLKDCFNELVYQGLMYHSQYTNMSKHR